MENPISSSSAASLAAAGQDNNNNNNQPPQLRCPRCDSANTKFCYYNNYSLSQPRHFCKSCKRYWTRGGTLRNVPVGGGCRKNHKRPNSSTPAANKRFPLPLPSSSSSATSTLVLESPNHHNNQINNPLLYGLQHSPAPAASSHHPHHLVSSLSSNGLEYSGISPSMATLLASTLNNKFSSSSTSSNGVVKPDHYSGGFEGLQMGIHGVVKAHHQQEQGQDWNINNFGSNQNNLGWGQVLMNDHHHHHNQVVEGVGSGQEPGYWTGLWSDPGSNNIGPSVTSLI